MTHPRPVEITTRDGCALRGHLWTGGDDWIVLVHDVRSDDDLDAWQALLPGLRALSVSICAVDLRGHGASDGDWSEATAVGDMVSMVRFARANGARVIVVVGAGETVVPVLTAAAHEPIDGVVSLSSGNSVPFEVSRPFTKIGDECLTSPSMGDLPRAAGTPKLFLVGAHDRTAREMTDRLHRASVGWSVIVTLPTGEHGTDLLDGEWLTHIREQIAGFVRERRYVARAAEAETGERSRQ